MQSSDKLFNCRNSLLSQLAELQVEPNGFGDRGRVIMCPARNGVATARSSTARPHGTSCERPVAWQNLPRGPGNLSAMKLPPARTAGCRSPSRSSSLWHLTDVACQGKSDAFAAFAFLRAASGRRDLPTLVFIGTSTQRSPCCAVPASRLVQQAHCQRTGPERRHGPKPPERGDAPAQREQPHPGFADDPVPAVRPGPHTPRPCTGGSSGKRSKAGPRRSSSRCDAMRPRGRRGRNDRRGRRCHCRPTMSRRAASAFPPARS